MLSNEFQAKVEKAEAQAKIEYQEQLNEFRSKRAEAQKKLENLAKGI